MSANVEVMFYTREKPWHGLGTKVASALSSREALSASGLDWKVVQRAIITEDGITIDGYKANVRDIDNKILGVVTDRYKVVQNKEAFAFTDDLLGNGVRYETAGSLQEGRKTWMLAKLPNEYIMLGDRISPYLVFSNTHDGSGAIRVAMTPIRVVCQNTLNLALSTATRSWSTIHTGDIRSKLDDARQTIFMAEKYMDYLGKEFEILNKIRLSDSKVIELINLLLPLDDANTSAIQERNVIRLRNDMKSRYFDAPDLTDVGRNGYRFVNAVSDFATHSKPLRETSNFKENLFARTMDGNVMIDKAYEMVKAVA
jgi:phage/plasmid-like protein (TIGR03299 family)